MDGVWLVGLRSSTCMLFVALCISAQDVFLRRMCPATSCELRSPPWRMKPRCWAGRPVELQRWDQVFQAAGQRLMVARAV